MRREVCHARAECYREGGPEQLAVAAAVLGDAIGAFLGILAVAAASVARTIYFFDEARDGLPAEMETATRLAATAESYYGMTATTPEEAATSIAATRALASAWTSKFDPVSEDDDDARFSQILLGFVQASACGIAWELSGRSIVAPAVALALTAMDVYVLRSDTELSRATLALSSLVSSE